MMSVLALALPRAARAGTCAPAVELVGDAAVAAPIAAQLRALGDPPADGSRAPGDTCPSVRVEVEPTADGAIAITLRALSGRDETRVVSTAQIASAWIDSWARDELVAPMMMSAVAAPSGSQAPDAEAPVGAGLHASTAAARPSTGLLARTMWFGAYEHAWSSDGNGWNGATVAGCARLGRACVGARVRAAFEPELPAHMSAASRDDLSALAIGRWNLALGGLAVAPEFGVGVGRFSTSRHEICQAPPTCPEPGSPSCQPPPACDSGVYVGDALHASTITPRFEGAVGISVPVTRDLWLDGTAGVTASVGAHTDEFSTTRPPMGVQPQQVALPGEPSAAFQLAIGLRVGGSS
jgi:hypothetical protein